MNRQELTRIKNDTYPHLIERLEKGGFVIDGEDIYLRAISTKNKRELF